jgi:PRC-barrel domain
MDDLGAPTSYLTLQPGTSAYDASGERIGKVEHVLAAPEEDVFDGLILDVTMGLGGLRFADADQVEEIHEHGVVLKVPVEELHDPEPAPGVLRADPADAEVSPLQEKLRRAWDLISGRY